MTASKPTRRLIGSAAAIAAHEADSDALVPIVERPDGFYWVAPDGRQQFGPFATLEEARADRDRGDEEGPQVGETLQEAESEIGLAEWIDPETGEPAGSPAAPRLPPE
jgi:hypothetical protein